MKTPVALDIVDQALSLAKGKDIAVAETLVQIIGEAVQADQDHTGEPLDPELIKSEEPV